MSEEKPSTETWDDFQGRYFKAISVNSWPAEAVVASVDAKTDDKGVNKLVLGMKYGKRNYLFEPNQTNTKILMASVPSGPKALVGKKLVFEKIQARNPQTQQFVDSLAIKSVL